MNVITLDGNLAADPGELREISDDFCARTVRVAHTLPGKEPSTLFIDCEVTNGWARNLNGAKGDPVVVTGVLAQGPLDEGRRKPFEGLRESSGDKTSRTTRGGNFQQ